MSDGLADLKQIQYRVKKGNNGVGWSNLALFAIFEKQQVSADPVYFYTIAENRHFQKNTGTLKIIFLLNLQKPSLNSTSKNKSHDANFKLKFLNIFFIFKKWAKRFFI